MPKQRALTLILPVLPDCLAGLRSILADIQDSVDNGAFAEVESIGVIHYFRIVLLEDKLSTAKTNLMLSSDYDGDEDEHLTLLSTRCTGIIDKVCGCCAGYPSERTPSARKKYLQDSRTKAEAFYVGAPGRGLAQIRQESVLRDYIWQFISKGKWDGKTAKEVHATIRRHVLEQPEFAWVNERIRTPTVKWWNFALLFLVALLLLPITVLFAIVALVWLVTLHFLHEKKDKALGLNLSQVDGSFIADLEKDEDHFNQNQFSQIVAMKPGKMRLISFKAIMIYGGFRCNNEFVKGELMGIPTIHFARWVLLDGDKSVLFLSNFDGSWEQYLGDFIDKSGWGLTAIFSNTVNFPPARYLFWGGAYDQEHFLAWARSTQVPTQVWYSAYPNLSIKNINTNTFIRSELMRDLNEAGAQNFLNRF